MASLSTGSPSSKPLSILDYLSTAMSLQELNHLYTDKFTVLTLFRILPALSKQYIMRLITFPVNYPISSETILSWHYSYALFGTLHPNGTINHILKTLKHADRSSSTSTIHPNQLQRIKYHNMINIESLKCLFSLKILQRDPTTLKQKNSSIQRLTTKPPFYQYILNPYFHSSLLLALSTTNPLSLHLSPYIFSKNISIAPENTQQQHQSMDTPDTAIPSIPSIHHPTRDEPITPNMENAYLSHDVIFPQSVSKLSLGVSTTGEAVVVNPYALLMDRDSKKITTIPILPSETNAAANERLTIDTPTDTIDPNTMTDDVGGLILFKKQIEPKLAKTVPGGPKPVDFYAMNIPNVFCGDLDLLLSGTSTPSNYDNDRQPNNSNITNFPTLSPPFLYSYAIDQVNNISMVMLSLLNTQYKNNAVGLQLEQEVSYTPSQFLVTLLQKNGLITQRTKYSCEPTPEGLAYVLKTPQERVWMLLLLYFDLIRTETVVYKKFIESITSKHIEGEKVEKKVISAQTRSKYPLPSLNQVFQFLFHLTFSTVGTCLPIIRPSRQSSNINGPMNVEYCVTSEQYMILLQFSEFGLLYPLYASSLPSFDDIIMKDYMTTLNKTTGATTIQKLQKDGIILKKIPSKIQSNIIDKYDGIIGFYPTQLLTSLSNALKTTISSTSWNKNTKRPSLLERSGKNILSIPSSTTNEEASHDVDEDGIDYSDVIEQDIRHFTVFNANTHKSNTMSLENSAELCAQTGVSDPSLLGDDDAYDTHEDEADDDNDDEEMLTVTQEMYYALYKDQLSHETESSDIGNDHNPGSPENSDSTQNTSLTEDFKLKEHFLIVETTLKLYAFTSHQLHIAIMSYFVEFTYKLPNVCIGYITRKSIQFGIHHGLKIDDIIRWLTLHTHERMILNAMGLDHTITALGHHKPLVTATNAQNNYKLNRDTVIPMNVLHQMYIWATERDRYGCYDASKIDCKSKNSFEIMYKLCQEEEYWQKELIFYETFAKINKNTNVEKPPAGEFRDMIDAIKLNVPVILFADGSGGERGDKYTIIINRAYADNIVTRRKRGMQN